MLKLSYIILALFLMGSSCSSNGQSNAKSDSTLLVRNNATKIRLEFWETYPLHNILEFIIKADTVLREYVKINGLEILPPINPHTTELLKQQPGADSTMIELRKQFPLRNYLLGGFEPRKDSRTGNTINDCRLSNIQNNDTASFTELTNLEVVRNELPKDIKFCYGKTAFKELSALNMSVVYAIKKPAPHVNRPFMDAYAIRSASLIEGEDGIITIKIQLNKRGTQIWERATTKNINFPIAIIWDNYVYATFTSQDAIRDGQFSITGSFNLQEAEYIVSSINGRE